MGIISNERDRQNWNNMLRNTADNFEKNGKSIVAGSMGGGAETVVTDNYLVDINITINLNLSEAIDKQSLESFESVLKRLENLVAMSKPGYIAEEEKDVLK